MKRYRLIRDLPTFNAGETFELSDDGDLWQDGGDKVRAYHRITLAKFPNILTDWFEESKEYWYIGDDGTIYKGESEETGQTEFRKLIGNYFETKEEAEKAVEKLKAWKRLRDYWETEILGWETKDVLTGENWQTVNVKLNVKAKKEPMELLDSLFGGEE